MRIRPVAICFVQAKVIGRSGGQSAVAAAAYRSGLKLVDERTGDIHDYRKKQGVDYSDILTPIASTGLNDWLTDRSKLWNKVESSEIRYDAQLSREMIIAIPIELDREMMIKLVCDHVQASYVDRGMIADLNLHNLDSDNPHAHVILTMRELTIDAKGSVNFGQKNRSWNDKKLVETQKKEWEVLANQYLDRAGVASRIDSQSYEKQGINKIPQIHVGSAASRLEKRGIKTQRGDHNREVAIANQEIANTQTDINQANQELADLAAEFAAESERREAKYRAAKEQFLREKEAAKAPRIKKWDLGMSMVKKIDPQLVRSILQAAARLGTDYQAGNYHVQLLPHDEIKVSYHNNSVMIIYADKCNALPLDRSYTVDQYGLGLQRSIDILITDLDQPPQTEPEQLDQSDQPPQGEPGLELSQDIINHDAQIIDDPKIDTKPLFAKTRRQIDQGRYS